MHPLIIIGMHRSGTSLTVRLLKDLGIHMGSWLSRDAEAVHFQKINRRIYRSAGSRWGDIDSLLDAMRSESFIQAQTKMALDALFSHALLSYRNPGIEGYFGQPLWQTISRGDPVWWGWKDPRTALTFPVWLRIFPQARFLHIIRNGIDVAVSIHQRSQKQRQKIWKRIYPVDYIPVTLDFQYCFQLWEKYISFILSNKVIIPPDHYLELRFEELLANPEEKLRDILRFIECPVRDDLLAATCEQINKGRLNNTEYTRLYQDEIPSLACSPLMQQLGYSYKVVSKESKEVKIES